MKWLLGLMVTLASMQAVAAESLRCVADSSSNTKFGFVAPNYTAKNALSAFIIVPGVLSTSDRLELDFIAQSKYGYTDFEGLVISRTYSTATMWLNMDRLDGMGRFRGQITLYPGTLKIPLICRILDVRS